MYIYFFLRWHSLLLPFFFGRFLCRSIFSLIMCCHEKMTQNKSMPSVRRTGVIQSIWYLKKMFSMLHEQRKKRTNYVDVGSLRAFTTFPRKLFVSVLNNSGRWRRLITSNFMGKHATRFNHNLIRKSLQQNVQRMTSFGMAVGSCCRYQVLNPDQHMALFRRFFCCDFWCTVPFFFRKQIFHEFNTVVFLL